MSSFSYSFLKTLFYAGFLVLEFFDYIRFNSIFVYLWASVYRGLVRVYRGLVGAIKYHTAIVIELF